VLAITIKIRTPVHGESLHRRPFINPPTVTLLEMRPQRFEDTLEFDGIVHPIREISLEFEIGGVIERYDFKEGDKIRKGEIIAQLNQRDYYLKWKKALLELEQGNLYPLEQRSSSVNGAELKKSVAQAALELEKTVLRCPWDGVLTEKYKVIGQTVTPKEAIGALGGTEKIVVQFSVQATNIDKISPGQKTLFHPETDPDYEFTGRVDSVAPVHDLEGTVQTVFANEGAVLLPGTKGTLRVILFEQDKSLFVPNEATQKTPTGYRVYVTTKENKAEERNIEISHESPTISLISQGLTPGDRVITPFPENLNPGDTVLITK
jgi:membrane fusion protein (multidrug efflux system)